MYEYQVFARDLEEGKLTYSVASVAGTGGTEAPPSGMVMNPRTGRLTWTPTAAQLGEHRLRVAVADEHGATTAENFTISVYDPAANRPPVIDSDEPHPVAILAKAGDPAIAYTYPFHAVDNDGNNRPLRYGKLSGPGSIDESTGVFTWTPSAAGKHQVTLTVADDALTVKKTFWLTARENAAPTLETIDSREVVRGQTLRVNLVGTDEDDDRLSYSLENAPPGMAVDAQGMLLWRTPTAFDLGLDQNGQPATSKTFTITARAVDLFAQTEQPLERTGYSSRAERTFDVTVTKDTAAPQIASIVFEKATVTVGETAVLVVDATDNVGITSLVVTTTAPDSTTKSVNVDFRGKGQFTVDQVGTWTISAVASDAEGNATTPPASASLVVEPDRHPPIVYFTSPRDGAVVTEPIEIIGTVDDKESDAANAAEYTLTARRSDGTGRTITLASGGEVKNDVLGFFDPTMLDNGMYDLTISAEDFEGNPSSRTVQIRVDGNLKPGAFSLQFTDIQIPGMGIPITVSRSYSTTRADRNLDFGYGWQLDLGKPDRDVDYAEGTTTGLGSARPMLENSTVDITLLDGSVESFRFRPIPGEFNLVGQATFYVPYFEPERGNTSYLFVDDVKLLRIETGNGNHEYIDMYTGQSYNPASSTFGGAYKVAMHDGTVYGIDAQADAFAWIEDRNKNRITFTDNGITSSNGRSVQFVRSCGDCPITKLVVPDDTPNDASDNPFIEYHYDGAGNLIGVTDLAGATTDFAYPASGPAANDPFQSHLITHVVDALGRVTAQNEYDSTTGRLTSLTDASGTVTTNDYAAGTRQQTITSADAVTTLVYDRRGNVITQTVAPTGPSNDPPIITVRQYDGRNNLTEETQVLGAVDGVGNGETDDLVTQYTYDSFRAPVSSADPRGNRSRLSYDAFGSVVGAMDPLGNTTRYAYDERGNLTEAIDPSKVKTTFTYDSFGNLTSAKNDSAIQLVANTLDSFGQVARSVSATGRSNYFRYDALGRTTHTWYVEEVEGTKTKFVDFTDYDVAGRVEATKHYGFDVVDGAADETLPDLTVLTPLWQTSTEYNALGQVTSSTDRQGLTTTTLYDRRGLAIQTRSEAVPTGALPGSTDSRWTVTRTVYDAQGRAILTTEPYLESTDPSEIGTGNPAPETVLKGTVTTYDAAGRATRSERVTNVVVTITGSTDQLREATFNQTGTGAVEVQSFSTTIYDQLGRVVASVDEFGLQSENRYNKFGELVESRRQVPPSAVLPGDVSASSFSSVWLVTRTVYNSSGQAIFVSDQFIVTVDGQDVETIVTQDGKLYGTITRYDAQGRVVKTQRITGAEVLFTASGDTELTRAGTVLSTSETVYNAKGQVSKAIAPDGQITAHEYDSLGRRTATMGHAVPAFSVQLPAAVMATIDNPAATKVRLRSETVYRADGKVDREISNLIVIVKADGTIETNRSFRQESIFEYDSRGNQTSVLRQGYDAGTQPSTSVLTSAEYNDQGDRIEETDEMGLSKNFEYDSHRRLSAVVLPAVPDPLDIDSVTGLPRNKRPRYEYGYDAMGNQTLIRDPLGRETHFTFDAHGNQTSRQLPLGVESVTFGDFTEQFDCLDNQGRLTLHVSFEGIGTRSVYDSTTGMLSEQRFYATAPECNTSSDTPDEIWARSYDAFGRETAVIQDADGNLGTTADQRITSRLFDTTGAIVSVQSPEGTIHYDYDSLGRQIRTWTGPDSQSVRTDTRYSFDSLGRLSQVELKVQNGVIPSSFEVTDYIYGLSGNLKQARGANGVIAEYQYDALSRLELLRHFKDANANGTYESAVDTLLAEFDYDLRADGKRTGVTETDDQGRVSRIDWTYDGVGRLVREAFNSHDNSLAFLTDYQFDLVGNRLAKLTDANPDWTALAGGAAPSFDETIVYSYDSNDRLLVESLDATGDGIAEKTTTYGWFATHQASKAEWQGTDTDPSTGASISQMDFQFNLQSRMSGATDDSDGDGTVDSTIAYGYDFRNIRVSHTVNGVTTRYLFDHHNPTGYVQVLEETDAVGELIRSYALGLDVVSQFTSSLPSPTSTLTFLYDGHGSTRALTDAVGSVAVVGGVSQNFAFDAYGNPNGFSESTAATLLLYSGEWSQRDVPYQYCERCIRGVFVRLIT